VAAKNCLLVEVWKIGGRKSTDLVVAIR